MNLQGVIFDIDGTLVDSNDLHATCWLEVFASFGKAFDYGLIRDQMGKGGDLLVPDLLSAREMRHFGKELQKRRSEVFKASYLPRVKPFPWVRSCFQTLHDRGVALALASSSGEEEVRHYEHLLGVEELLEGTTSKKDARFSKPSPEIFEAALEIVGSEPARTLTVGDTPYDVLASHRVPLPIAAVLSGGFQAATMSKAEFVFSDVEELVRKIDEVDDYFNE